MGKRELIALLNLSSWRLVMVERLFLAVPRGCLQFVIVVFPDHTHLLFLGLISSRGGFVVKLVIGVISINEEQQHAVERCGIITSYPVTIICPENIVYFSRLLSAVYIQVHFRPDFFMEANNMIWTMIMQAVWFWSYCLQHRLPKNISRREEQTTGGLRVNVTNKKYINKIITKFF